MTTARDIMNAGVTCVGEHETLGAAGQHVREHDIGALPICGDDDQLYGMLTDRDIVIKALAAGLDPNTTTAGQLARNNVYYVTADSSIQEMLNVMEEHQIRRLPVVADRRLAVMVTEGDMPDTCPSMPSCSSSRRFARPRPSPVDSAGGLYCSAIMNSTYAKPAIGHQFRRLGHA